MKIKRILSSAVDALKVIFVWILVLEIIAQISVYFFPRLINPDDMRKEADGYQSADWVDDYYQELSDAGQVSWHSYIYWRRQPYSGNYINVNHEGIRATWRNEEHKVPNDTLRVFLFGGSTMWGTGVRDDFTIASQLAKALANEKDVYFDITNFGETGYTNTQELINLVVALRKGDIPDLAIFYDGVNDVYSAFQNLEAGLPQNEFRREREFNLLKLRGEKTTSLVISAIHLTLAKLAIVQMVETFLKEKILYNRQRKVLMSRVPQQTTKQLAKEIVEIYTSNIKAIQALAEEYQFQTLLYWQPVIFSKRVLTRYELEQQEKYRYLRELFIETYNLVLEHDELKRNPSFHNVSNLFDRKCMPIYIDFCHVSETANEIIGYRISSDLPASLSSGSQENEVNSNATKGRRTSYSRQQMYN